MAVAGKVAGIYRKGDGASTSFTNLVLQDTGDHKTFRAPIASPNKYWDKSQVLTVQADVGGGFATPATAYVVQHPSGYVVFDSPLPFTGVAGARAYTVAVNVIAGTTVTIDGVTLTCVASGANTSQFNLGGTSTATASNLATAINTNAALSAKYAATTSTNTFTLTEKSAGGGNTPSEATVVGTGTINSGAATNSSVTFASSVRVSGYSFQIVQVGGAFSWNLDMKNDVLDATTFEGTGWKEVVVAFREYTAKIEKFWVTNDIDLFTKEFLFVFFITTQADHARFEGWGIVQGESVAVAVGELIKAPLEIQGTDGIYFRRD